MKCLVTVGDLATESFPEIGDHLLSRGVTPLFGSPEDWSNERALASALSDVDGILAGEEQYTERHFASAPKLRIVSVAGVDHGSVDLEAATKRGIMVTASPVAEYSEAVAEEAFGLILGLNKKILQRNAATKNRGTHG